MGGYTNYNVGAPGYVADHGNVRRDPIGRQVDWAQVGEEYRDTPGQRVVAAATAQGATTLNVAALSRALPSGTVLQFDAAAGEYATTTAAAAAGATTVAVTALVSALEGSEVAVVAGTGSKVLKDGTPVMYNTTSLKVVPRGVGALPGGYAALGLLIGNAREDYGIGKTDALTGYGVMIGGTVWENMLPRLPSGATAIDTTVRNELRGLDGGGFVFKTYSDSVAS